ncbi:hypothetical protein D0662_08955 [Salmonella enterica]|nr:hypothetical protein [Salmonella enterica]EFP3022236.1 hypothetical protein [Salmonella enterica]EFS4425200.1 hypothetical protein [Salmonella enterica]EGS9054471.1 hypothetical protein [Salmonella enterica]EJP0856975.1 hypothetical protein [Salmonella enterica]
MIDANLINLPWATLVTLASGYIGYFIANVGLKDHHKPIDITFSTLIFGLFAAMVYQAFIWKGYGEYLATFTAVTAALISGACWRKYLRKLMYLILRKLDISWSDSTSSAWQRMFDQRGYYVSQVYVTLKNGTVLLSEAPGNFEGLPCGAFVLGNEKDILLYVTHEKAPGSIEWVKCKDVILEEWGALSTYIPKDQIARVDIRRTTAKSTVVLDDD